MLTLLCHIVVMKSTDYAVFYCFSTKNVFVLLKIGLRKKQFDDGLCDRGDLYCWREIKTDRLPGECRAGGQCYAVVLSSRGSVSRLGIYVASVGLISVDSAGRGGVRLPVMGGMTGIYRVRCPAAGAVCRGGVLCPLSGGRCGLPGVCQSVRNLSSSALTFFFTFTLGFS